MTFFDQLMRLMSDALSDTSRYAPLVLALASFIEYVFPPFPGDTVVLLGAWYAVKGMLSWPMTFAAVMTGAVFGALIDYQIGVWIGRGLDRSTGKRGLLTAEQIARFEAGYRRWGALFLIANRFLPGVRAFLFIAAGAAHIPIGEVLLFGAISAALWNGLLLLAGGALVRNFTDLGALFSRYTLAIWLLLAAFALFFSIRALLRRRRAKGPDGGAR